MASHGRNNTDALPASERFPALLTLYCTKKWRHVVYVCGKSW